MSEQDGRITPKEYYKIGLEEIRENNHLKNVNIIEHNKVVNGISIGLLFTFLRFQELFGEVGLPLSIGFILPITTVLFNMIAFYPTQWAFKKNEEKIKKTYHEYSRTAHLIRNPANTVVYYIEVFSHFSFWLSLFFVFYLLYRIFGG